MRSSGMRDTGSMLLGAGIGAALMFLMDPKSGNRRRSFVRDQMLSFAKETAHLANRRGQDWMNRARGAVIELWRGTQESGIDDDMLEQRARAQVGHVVSHPGALEFTAHDGTVLIAGPVLRGEKMRIEERLRKTRGVRGIDLSGIHEHGSAERISGLQGNVRSQRKFGT